jgi:hypothetical protein
MLNNGMLRDGTELSSALQPTIRQEPFRLSEAARFRAYRSMSGLRNQY